MRNWQVSIALVCILLGIFLVAQLRTQQAKGSASLGRLDALSELYKHSEEQRELLELEVAKLREQLTEQEKASESAVAEELQKLRILSGLTSLSGPGIVLTLDDSKLKGNEDAPADMYLIHYEDLLLVVNELFAAGAEAVSINGQRIITTSEIRCAGLPYWSIPPVTPPLRFCHRRCPTLQSSLEMRGGSSSPCGRGVFKFPSPRKTRSPFLHIKGP